MKIKITGKNADLLQEFLTSVINVACAIAWRGAENLYWNLDGDKYDLCPATNNYWAFVRERGDNFIVLEFRYRYDSTGLADAMCVLMKARFNDEIELILE